MDSLFYRQHVFEQSLGLYGVNKKRLAVAKLYETPAVALTRNTNRHLSLAVMVSDEFSENFDQISALEMAFVNRKGLVF